MGLLDNLLGNASEVDVRGLEGDFATLLVPGKGTEHAYRLWRDLLVFTNKRLIMLGKQGLTGKKKEFLSLPYGSITQFSKEGAGRFDAEIRIWVRGDPGPTQFEFRRDKNVDDVYRVLSTYILK